MNYEIFEKINKILSYLEDEESKKIFLQRVLYRMSGDMEHIFRIASYSNAFKFEDLYSRYLEIDEKYHIYSRMDVLNFLISKDYKEKKIILFGVGNWGRMIYQLLDCVGIEVFAVWDNHKAGETFFRHTVRKPETDDILLEQGLFLISSPVYAEEMSAQLREMGIQEETIFLPDINSIIAYYGTPYFDPDFFKPKKNAVFIDGGAWGMETAIDFSKQCPDYKQIYSFEPDAINYARCENTIKEKQLKNMKVFPCGLWEEEGVLHFTRAGDDGGGSFIGEDGTTTVQVDSIDHVLQGERADFIKMDIEGSELSALEGAKQTIQKYKPWLAICLYHKPDDIFEIPLYIKELVPEYKMGIRHYSTYVYDTVLYCWVE